ncbi:hypothetical protein E2562_011690 [Oryza meyeriana var. granulata]|uniref:Uncharacterized protein n=1 Tax=Oryza meyeriana var. granulata TaxID=110450 RepID=A0A6G1DGV0_9ORYZ|nr:hypothetical protein E2562_011690 [Oryza meyeriana var. granulata]
MFCKRPVSSPWQNVTTGMENGFLMTVDHYIQYIGSLWRRIKQDPPPAFSAAASTVPASATTAAFPAAPTDTVGAGLTAAWHVEPAGWYVIPAVPVVAAGASAASTGAAGVARLAVHRKRSSDVGGHRAL